jgi:hypothetical protein
MIALTSRQLRYVLQFIAGALLALFLSFMGWQLALIS